MGESISFKTRLWLINNYHVVTGVNTTLSEIIKHVQQDNENSNVKCVSRGNQLGSLIQDIWGDTINIRRCQIPGTNQRTTKYTNLCKINKESLSSHTPVMSWDQLKLYCPPGWNISSICDDCLAWIRMSTNTDTVNGCRILTEVQISRVADKLSVFVKYGCHSVNIEKIGFQPSEFFSAGGVTCLKINALLTMVTNTSFCPGVEWTGSIMANNSKRELWKISETEVMKLRNTDCELFCKFTSYCTKCHYLKRQLHAKRALYSSCDNNKRKKLKSMDREELIETLRKEQRLCRNAEASEKLDDDMLEFDSNDHDDFKEMFKLIDEKELGDDMKNLLQQQKKCLSQESANAYRWHPRIIRLCLSIYARSPHVYDELAKVLILPSKRTLIYKKNKNPQEPGWTYESMKDLKRAADEKGLKDVDRWGGLCFDEMAIQEDLQIIKCHGKSKLVGIVSLGQDSQEMEILLKGEIKPQTATHVLQFVFVGDGGFRYPVKSTKECPPATLYGVFWEGVQMLLKAGFHIYWSCCDGGERNRGFINLHFKDKTARESDFTTRNPLTGGKMIFIMDSKHNIKQIRNNLQKSNNKGKTELKHNGNEILWKYWFNAYNADQTENTMVVHERLTEEHFKMTAKLKMRNHLAEDVLDRKMLLVMQAYKRNLSERTRQSVTYLDSAIELLSHTSNLVSFVNDVENPVRDIADTRLQDSKKFLTYLDTWNREQPQHFISKNLYFDMQSQLIGFEQLCRYKLSIFPSSSIMPGIVNQDVCCGKHFLPS